jgi:hypothetical protein
MIKLRARLTPLVISCLNLPPIIKYFGYVQSSRYHHQNPFCLSTILFYSSVRHNHLRSSSQVHEFGIGNQVKMVHHWATSFLFLCQSNILILLVISYQIVDTQYSFLVRFSRIFLPTIANPLYIIKKKKVRGP